MSKAAKIWIIAGVSLLILGGIIFGGIMTMLKWDFTKLSSINMEKNNYEITEQFKNIKLYTKTAKVEFIPSEDEKIKVICYEQKKVKHSVTVLDNTLTIEAVDSRKWYEYIGIFFGSPKITVYLPKGEYGEFSIKNETGDAKIPADYTFESIEISQSTGNLEISASVTNGVKIKTSTGDISLKNATVGGLDLAVSTGHVSAENIICSGDVSVKGSTGKIRFNNLKCKNFTSVSSTGDLCLNKVIVENKLSSSLSTGDVELNESDAFELYIKTSTGNVTGNLLSDKVYIAKSSTGNIEVPNSITGGRCEITTSTGNIKFI